MSAATIFPPNTEPDLPPGAVGVLTVDLDAIAENWRRLGAIVGAGTAVGAAVKADGYGLGMVPVAQALAAAGCRWFFVATFDEALALAAALDHPDARIAIFAGPEPATVSEIARHASLVPVLNDLGQLALWHGGPAILNLDTGMARLGLSSPEALRLAAEPERLAGVALVAVMSHLASADDPASPLNALQRTRFEALAAALPAAPRSLAASSGVFLGPAYHFELIRAGAALYGLNPTPGRPNPMRQVVGLKAKILQVREIDRGMSVGYGATFTTDRPRRVATLGIGYADGLLRSAGNRARCHIGAMEAAVLGRISMDLATVDVSAVPAELARPGGFADLIGPHHPVDALAEECGTIGYELLTRLGSRLHRVYRSGAR